MTFRSRFAVCVLVLLVGSSLFPQCSLAQQQQVPGIPDASQQGVSQQGDKRPGESGDRTLDDLLRDNQRKLNKQRQQDLKRDTDKLLDLATELKKYVDKSNENVLSLEVLRKAEEIEKLARSVKDKMKGQ